MDYPGDLRKAYRVFWLLKTLKQLHRGYFLSRTPEREPMSEPVAKVAEVADHPLYSLYAHDFARPEEGGYCTSVSIWRKAAGVQSQPLAVLRLETPCPADAELLTELSMDLNAGGWFRANGHRISIAPQATRSGRKRQRVLAHRARKARQSGARSGPVPESKGAKAGHS
jgi:hypothetical protein